MGVHLLTMRFGLVSVLYIVVGVLVAAGVIGEEPNLFSGLNTIEELVEVILTVLLWPLVLLGLDFHIGDINVGAGGSSGADSGAGKGGGK
jgi:hypothetical protein